MNYVKQLSLAMLVLVVPSVFASYLDTTADYAKWTVSGFGKKDAKDVYTPNRLGQAALVAGGAAVGAVLYKKSPWIQGKVDAVYDWAKEGVDNVIEGKDHARAKAATVAAVIIAYNLRSQIGGGASAGFNRVQGYFNSTKPSTGSSNAPQAAANKV